MTITLYWWYLSIILFVFPFIYATLRKPKGGYDVQEDTVIVAIACWSSCIIFTLTKLLD